MNKDTFWGKVIVAGDDDCWPWTGAITSSGYGNLNWEGKTVQAHRIAFLLAVGGIEPHTGFRNTEVAKTYTQFVLHTCDNRLCCNPKHLFLGTMRLNQLDAYNKKRKIQPQGSTHVNAKLTDKQVKEIRELYAAGPGKWRQVDLAKKYGVSQRVISLIVRNLAYKQV